MTFYFQGAGSTSNNFQVTGEQALNFGELGGGGGGGALSTPPDPTLHNSI